MPRSCLDCSIPIAPSEPEYKTRCRSCYSKHRNKLKTRVCETCFNTFNGEAWKKTCITCFKKQKKEEKDRQNPIEKVYTQTTNTGSEIYNSGFLAGVQAARAASNKTKRLEFF